MAWARNSYIQYCSWADANKSITAEMKLSISKLLALATLGAETGATSSRFDAMVEIAMPPTPPGSCAYPANCPNQVRDSRQCFCTFTHVPC